MPAHHLGSSLGESESRYCCLALAKIDRGGSRTPGGLSGYRRALKAGLKRSLAYCGHGSKLKGVSQSTTVIPTYFYKAIEARAPVTRVLRRSSKSCATSAPSRRT